MFNSNIRRIRLQKGLTQLELARRTKISPADLSLLERGQMVIYPGWKKRLSQALDVSENELFEEGCEVGE